jgi:hypothetical protein
MPINASSSNKCAAPNDSQWRSISTKPSRRPVLEPKEWHHRLCKENKIHKEVLHYLEDCDAELAILSRAGSDLGAYRFDTEAPRYTHSGFVVKVDGEWRVDHLINRHEGCHGHLVRHALIDFFRDDPFAYKIGVLVPSISLQRDIADLLASKLREKLFCRDYSRLAHPCSTRYQNSNQWLVEIIGAAQSSLTERGAVQHYLRRQGLKPTVLRLNPGLQFIAKTLSVNTRLDDHPWRSRLEGRIEFLIEPSIRQYLLANDPRCLVAHLSIEADQASSTMAVSNTTIDGFAQGNLAA